MKKQIVSILCALLIALAMIAARPSAKPAKGGGPGIHCVRTPYGVVCF